MCTCVDKFYAFIIISLINGSTGLYPWQTDFAVEHVACDSRECAEQAKFLAGLLDPKIEPCDDFYGHVCSRWQKKYTLSGYYPEWSVDMLMATQAFERLKDILESNPVRQDSINMQQAKGLYRACMNIPFMGILEAPLLIPYIEEANYFPLFLKKSESSVFWSRSWLDVHNHYLSLTGESAFFSIQIEGNIEEKMKPMLHISRMMSPFGLMESFGVLTVTKLRLYKEFLLALIDHLIPASMHKVSRSLIEKRLLDVLVFRRMLWKITKDGGEISDKCEPMIMKTFDETYSVKSSISWSKILYALYKNTRNPFSVIKMKICIEKMAYFKSLIGLLNSTSHQIVVNHIHIYFIERHLQLTPHLKDLLLKVVIHHGKLEEKIRYLGRKHVKCIISSNKKDAFGRAYINKYFPISTKEEGEMLINEVKQVMKIQINQSTWLDHDTVDIAIKTINDMKMAVGYPEYYDDPSLRTEYKKQSEHVQPVLNEVFYSARTNRLSISAAYFNKPLYDPMFPRNVVYGTLGTFIGHEMYHAFSTAVLYSVRFPTLWSKKMLGHHTKQSMCFVYQYDKKPLRELKDIPNAPMTDGKRTMDENIADSMGLELAYWTFRRKTWATRRCPMLKHLPQISCEQLFFVSYAMTFCTSMTIDRMLDLAQHDTHSPERWRVNGAVSNMKEFSNAFKCPYDSPMNPSSKCNLWK